MTYEETLQYLYSQLPVFQHNGASAYKPGLANSEALDSYFGHPHKKFHTIHVAGTNGKGSVSHLLAATLQESGYKVGLYTSPHLIDFRERIRVNGEMIEKEFVMEFAEKHIPPTRHIQPSFFELTMMMAFCYFAHREVDVAIVEVGLGGRLDSTNIISPDLCVITNISYDHMQFLGNSLKEIAQEKAGIIKHAVPVVIGEAEGEVKKVFCEKAETVDTSIIFAEEENRITHASLLPNGRWLFENEEYPRLEGELGGYCQKKNAVTVLSAINQLKKLQYNIPGEAVYTGFSKVTTLTGLLGRWQQLSHSPRTFCDTGHNKAGIELIVAQLAQVTCDKLHIVMGMVNDKDVRSVLQLLPKDACYYFTQASIPRAINADELRETAKEFHLQGNAYPTVYEAYLAAKKESRPEDFIFIGGSTFVVADLLTELIP